MSFLCPECRRSMADEASRCPEHKKRGTRDFTDHVIAERYEVRELIDVGGMKSSVWRAWQRSTKRVVAVKMIPPTSEGSAKRFSRGARIASNLNHPNIITVHDYGRTTDDYLYLVLELLAGTSLQAVLRTGNELTMPRALDIVAQTLRALEHAHANGVVHRDLKPGNLYLTDTMGDQDHVKVLDFGIAKFVDATQESDPQDSWMEVTTTGEVCGTPYYMAPEQVAGENVDGRIDLYAAGVVLYRMLTGRLPFTGRSFQELYRKHLLEDPPLFSEVRPDLEIPPDVESLVHRAMAKDRDDRFGSAREMRLAVRDVRNNLGLRLEDTNEESREGAPRKPPSNAELWVDGPPSETTRTAVPVSHSTGVHRGVSVVLSIVIVLFAGWAVLSGVFGGSGESPSAVGEPARNGDGSVVTPEQARTGTEPATGEDAETSPEPVAGSSNTDNEDASEAEPDPAAEAGESGEGESAEPPKAPVPVRVRVITVPDGATVVWDGRPIGVTPLDATIPSGERRLFLFKNGYKAETIELALRDDEGPNGVVKVLKLVAVEGAPDLEVEPRTAPGDSMSKTQGATSARKERSKKARKRRKRKRKPRVHRVDDDAAPPPPPPRKNSGPRIKLLGE